MPDSQYVPGIVIVRLLLLDPVWWHRSGTLDRAEAMLEEPRASLTALRFTRLLDRRRSEPPSFGFQMALEPGGGRPERAELVLALERDASTPLRRALTAQRNSDARPPCSDAGSSRTAAAQRPAQYGRNEPLALLPERRTEVKIERAAGRLWQNPCTVPYFPRSTRTSPPPPDNAPGDETFWAASTAGSGEQTLEWEPEEGDWTVLVMNTDATRGVAAELSIGAELDAVFWVGIGLLIAGGLLAAGAALAITAGVRRGRR